MNTKAMDAKEATKIHPQKFMLWIGMGSISMMFAGLTSAYVVRQAQGNWRYYNLPPIFWLSTLLILVSSVTLFLSLRDFRSRQMARFKALLTFTLLLGLAFGATQAVGFYQLFHQLQAVRINGQVLNDMQAVRINGNPSESFLYIIAGLHLAHLAGGLIALIIVYFRSTRKRVKVYSATGLEIAAAYWHFMDALWVYLFIFFLVNQ